MNSPETNFKKDLDNLNVIVDWAANILLTGSRSQRRPDLGKMFTCHFCGTRRLQGAPKCCNTRPATTKRAWDPEQGFHQVECEPRENEEMFSKSFKKRFTHKKHGQSRTNKLRALILRFMADQTLVEAAAKAMNVKVPVRENIPTFGQKYFFWLEDREQRRTRRQRDISRRINFGLASPASRYRNTNSWQGESKRKEEAQ